VKGEEGGTSRTTTGRNRMYMYFNSEERGRMLYDLGKEEKVQGRRTECLVS